VELKAHEIVALALEQLIVLMQLASEAPELERSLNANNELRGADWFRQKIVPTRAKRLVERIDIAQSREKENRRRGTVRKRSDPLADCEPVQVGHAHVKQDAVGPFFLEGCDPLGPPPATTTLYSSSSSVLFASRRLASLSSTTRTTGWRSPTEGELC
jgi:hypothetical protein